MLIAKGELLEEGTVMTEAQSTFVELDYTSVALAEIRKTLFSLDYLTKKLGRECRNERIPYLEDYRTFKIRCKYHLKTFRIAFKLGSGESK